MGKLIINDWIWGTSFRTSPWIEASHTYNISGKWERLHLERMPIWCISIIGLSASWQTSPKQRCPQKSLLTHFQQKLGKSLRKILRFRFSCTAVFMRGWRFRWICCSVIWRSKRLKCEGWCLAPGAAVFQDRMHKLGDETTREKKWHLNRPILVHAVHATEASFLVGRILSYTGVYTNICEHGWSWLILGLIWQFYAATTAFTSMINLFYNSFKALVQMFRRRPLG